MASLRAEIAELKRRLIAVEARQLAWRHATGAGGSPGSPDCWPGPAFELTDDMRAALDTLWQRSVEYGQPFAQVDIALYEDAVTVAARAWFRDGRETSVDFPKPADFDAIACRRAFEAHLEC
jgi:hypothetical protein